MSVYWIRFPGDSAADVINAIADALKRNEQGDAPDKECSDSVTGSEALTANDTYLQSNLQTMMKPGLLTRCGQNHRPTND